MRRIAANFLLALLLSAAAVFITAETPDELSTYPDAQSSIALSEGSSASVRLHHARRIFHPLVAGALSRLSGLGTNESFALLGKVTLVGFLFLLLFALPRGPGKSLDWTAITLVLLPYPLLLYQLCFLQTLMFAFLLAAFLHAARRDRLAVCGLLLFCLVLTREDGMLLGLTSAGALFFHGRRSDGSARMRSASFGFLVVLLFSQALIGYLARDSSNVYGVSFLQFSALRMPLFYLRNFFGIEHWVDSYRSLPFYTHPPLAAWPVPPFFARFANVREIGIYTWNPADVVDTAAYILGAFGILPYFVLRFWRRRAEYRRPEPIHWSFIALGVYGLVELVLAPGAGPAHLRYYVNAWPLFFWALLHFGDGAVGRLVRERPILLPLHLAAGWSMFLLDPTIAVPLIAGIYFAVWRLSANSTPKSDPLAST